MWVQFSVANSNWKKLPFLLEKRLSLRGCKVNLSKIKGDSKDKQENIKTGDNIINKELSKNDNSKKENKNDEGCDDNDDLKSILS